MSEFLKHCGLYNQTRSWVVALCLLAAPLCAPAPAWALDPVKPLHQFVLQNWRADQGLPQNSVLAIAQTQDGYLWLGTEEGLSRYDGVRFVTFDSSNSGLKDSTVRALLVDRQNTLWVGTQNGGLSKYEDGHFSAVSIPTQASNSSVSTLLEDQAGTIWVGTDNSGLIELGKGKYRRFTSSNGLPDNGIVSLSEGRDGALWIVTHRGLSQLRQDRFTHFGAQEGLASDDVRAVRVDHEGGVWVGTANGLNKIVSGRILTFTKKDGLGGNEITSLFEDRAHSLWIGTASSGLSRLADGKFSFISGDTTVGGTDIGAFFEDRQGDLWIGTGGHGLVGLQEGAFATLTTRDGLASNSILPVFEDAQGNLWIGSDSGLTRRGHGKTRIFTTNDGLPSDFVFSITQDKSGAIWVSTRLGISRIVGDHVQTFTAKEGWPKAFSLCLFADRKGNVWIGTREGLSRFDGHSIYTFTVNEGLPANFVRSIQEDLAGTLWVGTAAGLTAYSNGSFRTYTTQDGLSGNAVQSIYCDRDNVLWLATSKGLSRFRAGRFASFGKANPALEGLIVSVVEDRSGSLWLSSNRGIIKASKKELNRYGDGVAGQEVHTISFGTFDGLKSSECNGGFQPAGWSANDGKLYFPTTAGLAVTDPGQTVKRAGGTLVIERLLINNTEYPSMDAAVVPAGPGKLEIQFAAPNLHFQNKMQFRYMLDGFDKDWMNAGTRRTAYYTNIPHGEYRFRAQAGLNGVWSESSSSALLTLEPHFYETKAFFLFVAIAVFTIVAATYRVRADQVASRELKLRALVDERTSALRESEARLRESHEELELRVKDRTKELTHVNRSLQDEIQTRQQTEELLILAKESAESANRAKSQFLANMSHELRTPINGILGITEITLSTNLDPEQTEYLEIAKTSADSLLGIVNDILDFSKIEAHKLRLEHEPFQLRKAVNEAFRSLQLRASQKGLRFDLAIASDLPDELVGDSLRMRQVLLNLLDNALKFTKEGGVSLAVTTEGIAEGFVKVHFAVKDSGIGIHPDKSKSIFEAFSQADNSSTRRYGGTGLGLTISHELAVMLGGDLWVESEPGRGSTFHFTARLQLAPKAPSSRATLEPIARVSV